MSLALKALTLFPDVKVEDALSEMVSGSGPEVISAAIDTNELLQIAFESGHIFNNVLFQVLVEPKLPSGKDNLEGV